MSDILRELAHAKALFQLRAIEAVIRGPASGIAAPSGVETGNTDSTGTASTRAEGNRPNSIGTS